MSKGLDYIECRSPADSVEQLFGNQENVRAHRLNPLSGECLRDQRAEPCVIGRVIACKAERYVLCRCAFAPAAPDGLGAAAPAETTVTHHCQSVVVACDKPESAGCP